MRAIVLDNDGGFTARLTELSPDLLPAGDVTLRLHYSSLNYKDALAITNSAPIVRSWPMVPGIDGVGVVESSARPDFRPGDNVILTGWGVGERHWGCLAEQARVSGDWLVALPGGLSPFDSMAIGTGGLTAMLAVMALETHGVTPGSGEIVVTGAAGGVGSFAVMILASLGYAVVAVTGRPQQADYLSTLGATGILDRADLAAPGKPLQKERWAGAIDVAGGPILANLCAQTRYLGTVVACGLAQSLDLPASVAPFILRGVTLTGIDSVLAPMARRQAAWRRLTDIARLPQAGTIVSRIGLDDVIEICPALLGGEVRGRLVVETGAA